MIQYRPRPATRRIILHASHTVPDIEDPVLVLEVKGRERGLLTCGYHYVILADGTPIATRPHTCVGSHTTGFNEDSLGICLIGGCNEAGEPVDNFCARQIATLRFLRTFHVQHYGLLDVVGHSELGRYKHRRTPCPPLHMPTLRKTLEM